MTDFVVLPLLNPRGEYVPTTIYNPNDLITYNGVPYFCRVGIIQGQPVTPGSDPNVWQLLNEPGAPGEPGEKGEQGEQGPRGRPGPSGADGAGYRPRGAWDSGTAYFASDSVAYANAAVGTTTVWFALKDNTNVVPGSDATVWAAGVKGDTGDVTAAALAAQAAAQAAQAASALSAGQSASSAAAALTSKNNAATSEANALTYKNAASTSATNAASSASQAATSQGAASTSAGNAAASESNALTYKNNASTSATAAAGSATAAAGSATAASTSATNAAASATAAANSAASISSGKTNLVLNGTGELGTLGWSNTLPALSVGRDSDGSYFQFGAQATSFTGAFTSGAFPVIGGLAHNISGEVLIDAAATGNFYLDILYYSSTDGTGTPVLDGANNNRPGSPDGQWRTISGFDSAATVPAGAKSARARLVTSNATWTTLKVRRMKVEQGTTSSPFSMETSMMCLSPTPPANLSPIFQAVTVLGNLAVGGKMNAVNNPNLLFNGSAEFGGAGWVLGANFAAGNDLSGGVGTYFGHAGALANYTFSAASPAVQITAGIPATLTVDIANAATGGTLSLSFAAFDNTGTFISNIGSTVVPNGTGWTRYQLTGNTPAGTVKVYCYLNLTGVTAAAFAIAWRRVKIEYGSTPSLYSQEANFPALGMNGVRGSLPLDTTAKVNGINSPNLLANGSGEFGDIGWGSANFGSNQDGNGNGSIFYNAAALTGNSFYLDASSNISVGVNVSLILQAEIRTIGMTAGVAYLKVESYSAANALLQTNSTPLIGTGKDWSFVTVNLTTPASTAYVKISKVIDTAPNSPIGGTRFRRIKLELGTSPSLYSQEASVRYLQQNTLPLDGSLSMTGDITLNKTSPYIWFRKAGILNWGFGYNDGSNVALNRYNTGTGAYIDTPWYVASSNGQVVMNIRPTWGGVTPIDTGNMASTAVAYAANRLRLSAGGGSDSVWSYSGQGGQPGWLWGSNDGVNMFVWNPSNFSVNYANSCNVASSATNASGVVNGNRFTFSWDGGAGHVNLLVDGGLVAYVASNLSDMRLKENVVLNRGRDALSLLNSIKFYSFDWKEEGARKARHEESAFVAQQLRKVSPRYVHEPTKGEDPMKHPLGVNEQHLLQDAIRAIQQLSAEVEALKAQLKTQSQDTK